MVAPSAPRPDAQPDPSDLWRWVWRSTRPYLGHVFTVVGFLLLVVAYLGVSREVYVGRQIPYLVSGGLFGVAAVSLGSRLMLIEDLRRDSGRLDRLEQAVADLHQTLLTQPDAPVPGNGRHYSGSGGAQRLLMLPGGESFHRPDCPVLEGKPAAKSVTAQTAARRGLHACPLCQPLVAGV